MQAMNFVQTRFFFSRPGGPRKEVTVVVQSPEVDPDSLNPSEPDYRCAVTISGIASDRYVYGIDAFQSLSLAFVYLRYELERLEDGGCQFFYSTSDSERFFPMACFFGDHSRTPWGEAGTGSPKLAT